MANTYSWRPGFRAKIKAAVAGKELEKIRVANGGELRPTDVVAEAGDPEHPLHDQFDWQDKKAAHEWRLLQARQMINSIRITIEDDNQIPERIMFVRVTPPGSASCYKTSAEVMSDADLRQQALDDAIMLLRGVQKRYKHLEELAEVFLAIDQLKVRRKKSKVPA